MGQAIVAKLALISALAITAFASAELRLDTSALEVRPAEKSKAAQDRSLELAKKTALSDADLIETHARPLFSQNRRPFVPRPPVVEQQQVVAVEAVVEQPANLPRRLTLIGTNAGASASSVLVRNQDSAEVRWLRVGETFDGWRLAAATADSASFVCAENRNEDCDYRLALYSDARSE